MLCCHQTPRLSSKINIQKKKCCEHRQPFFFHKSDLLEVSGLLLRRLSEEAVELENQGRTSSHKSPRRGDGAPPRRHTGTRTSPRDAAPVPVATSHDLPLTRGTHLGGLEVVRPGHPQGTVATSHDLEPFEVGAAGKGRSP